MQHIPIANKIEFKPETPFKGRFVIEPFYPGFGLTVGNALRRVLLSSLRGAAITAIRLKGAEHEFSNIVGVKDDVVDIILNLKQVRFEVSGELSEPQKLELNVKGVKEVKAGDFKKVAGIKVVNPNLVLATLTDSKAEFELEAWVEKGRGYLPTEMMDKKEKEVGVITIDAIFTPIKRVSIDTENVRVGEMTNWDRLILSLETDGTILPEEALKQSAAVLVEQFNFFLTGADQEVKTKKEVEKETTPIVAVDAEQEAAVVEDKPKKKRGRPKKV